MIGSLLVPFGALGIGYLVRRLVRVPDALPRAVMTVVSFGVWPVVSCLSFWVIAFPTWRLALLPVAGGLNALACLVPAYALARWHRLTPQQTGSFLTCALFANIGYIGQFIIFALYGETALALTILYSVYFSPIMYSVGMSVAAHYGSEKGPGPMEKGPGPIEKGPGPFLESAEQASPEAMPSLWWRALPFAGMGLGLLLNVLGIDRPAWLGNVNRSLVPLSSMAYLFATGLALQIRSLGRWPGPAATISLVRFAYAPLVGLGLAYLFGFHVLLDGLPLKIMVIEAMMPIALSCMMLATLFRLDESFATALWLINTVAFLGWMPIALAVIQRIGAH